MLPNKNYKQFENYQKNNLLRNIIEIKSNTGRIINSKLINFSSNDYLGISKSDKLKQALTDSITTNGFGSTSSPLVSGYHSSTKKLEEEFAKTLKTEKAIFFNSGYHANLGIIQALDLPIVMDKLCHASIIDGARLSGNKFCRYQHSNYEHAEELLKKNSSSLLITERIFSMEGDITNTTEFKRLANKYNSTLIIDDAHGFGIMPNNIQSDLITIPLGKALGGVGAIVAGSRAYIDYLRQFTRSYAYSTALPAFIADANLAALVIMKNETWRLDKLKQLIKLFNAEANLLGLQLVSQDLTPIRSILIGDNKEAKLLEAKLQAKGFFVKAIVSPTVATSRIRISLCAFHTQNDVLSLIGALK